MLFSCEYPLVQKKLFPDVVKDVIEKHPYTQFDFFKLCFYYVFDLETELGSARLTILERLALQILFSPSKPWWGRLRHFPVFYQDRNAIMLY